MLLLGSLVCWLPDTSGRKRHRAAQPGLESLHAAQEHQPRRPPSAAICSVHLWKEVMTRNGRREQNPQHQHHAGQCSIHSTAALQAHPICPPRGDALNTKLHPKERGSQQHHPPTLGLLQGQPGQREAEHSSAKQPFFKKEKQIRKESGPLFCQPVCKARNSKQMFQNGEDNGDITTFRTNAATSS